MARKIHSRLRIEGTLVAETPLHVGGFGESIDTDLPLAQNGRGEWYVPGTSIAGVLRSWCLKHFGYLPFQAGKTLIQEIFGYQEADKGHASFVLIEDAAVILPDELVEGKKGKRNIQIEIRDGVGLDRFYGTAADKAKFDRAILPRGTKLNFQMIVDVGEDHDASQTKAVISLLLEALTHSKIRFGAARTRGLGRVRLDACKVKEENFNGFQAMLDILKGTNASNSYADWRSDFEKGLKDEEKPSLANLKSEPPYLEIIITWKPRLPVMVKAGYDGIGVDMLPLTSGVSKDQLALCLPGSSIKGAIRSHTERIMRTVLPDCDCTKGKENFHEQIDGIPLIEEIFGARNKSEKEGSSSQTNKKCKSNAKANLGLGALAIDDCYTQESDWMKAASWRKVEVAGDERAKDETQKNGQGQKQEKEKSEQSEVSYYQRELWRRLREIDLATGTLKEEQYKEPTQRFRINHHVAIDRWTGGAAEGALYSVLVPTQVAWEPIRLTLDFGRIANASQLPALMLLLLTLRDVAENHLPFGFATNRGMGEIEVTSFDFIGNGALETKELLIEPDGKFVEQGEITIDLNNALTATVEHSKCKFADGTLKEQMQRRWQQWLQ